MFPSGDLPRHWIWSIDLDYPPFYFIFGKAPNDTALWKNLSNRKTSHLPRDTNSSLPMTRHYASANLDRSTVVNLAGFSHDQELGQQNQLGPDLNMPHMAHNPGLLEAWCRRLKRGLLCL